MSQPFRILMVCTGNICRSPMAEQMLRQKFAARNIKSVEVKSAGVFAMVGDPMTKEVAVALTTAGYQPNAHVAAQVDAPMLESFDLILTATEEHRSDVVRTFTRANRKTFTLKEFANLVNYASHPDEDVELPIASGLQDKLAVTAMARGYAPELENLNIEDPYRQSQQVFDATRDELEPLLDSVADWVANA